MTSREQAAQTDGNGDPIRAWAAQSQDAQHGRGRLSEEQAFDRNQGRDHCRSDDKPRLPSVAAEGVAEQLKQDKDAAEAADESHPIRSGAGWLGVFGHRWIFPR
jgi:hypothetical protein